MRNGGCFSVAKDGMSDVYPLQLRLIVVQEANQLTLRISKRVCFNIFSILLIFIGFFWLPNSDGILNMIFIDTLKGFFHYSITL